MILAVLSHGGLIHSLLYTVPPLWSAPLIYESFFKHFYSVTSAEDIKRRQFEESQLGQQQGQGRGGMYETGQGRGTAFEQGQGRGEGRMQELTGVGGRTY